MPTRKILVITNDLRLALAACRHAQDLGLRGQVTSDPLYVLLQAIEDTPCLIIIDAATDGMDVYELCSTLRSDGRTCQTPIVLLVHASDKLAVQRCNLLDLHLVVKEAPAKPMPQRLEEFITGYLGRRPGELVPCQAPLGPTIPGIALN